MGARRWLPPDSDNLPSCFPEGWEPSPDVEDILRVIDETIGFEVAFPNRFPMEPDPRTSRGTASARAIYALHQTYRIAQELRESPNCSILEIGPGIGRTAFYSWQARFHDYTTIDLPLGVVVQACFLGATLGPDAIWMVGDDPEIASGKIRLLPSTALCRRTFGSGWSSMLILY